MSNNPTPQSLFTHQTLANLSAAVMADPSGHQDEFLYACDKAGVLRLVMAEHALSVITDHELVNWFDGYLDEHFGDSEVAGHRYLTSVALRRIDPIAHRQMFIEYADQEFVEHSGMYFKRDELHGLDRTEVLETLASHCVEQFALDDEDSEDLGSAGTPEEFVSVLKLLCLRKVASSTPAVAPQQDTRRM